MSRVSDSSRIVQAARHMSRTFTETVPKFGQVGAEVPQRRLRANCLGERGCPPLKGQSFLRGAATWHDLGDAPPRRRGTWDAPLPQDRWQFTTTPRPAHYGLAVHMAHSLHRRWITTCALEAPAGPTPLHAPTPKYNSRIVHDSWLSNACTIRAAHSTSNSVLAHHAEEQHPLDGDACRLRAT